MSVQAVTTTLFSNHHDFPNQPTTPQFVRFAAIVGYLVVRCHVHHVPHVSGGHDVFLRVVVFQFYLVR